MKYPEAIEKLIEHFMAYPGIGRRTAERYAIYTVNKLSNESIVAFSNAFLEVANTIKRCSVCGHITDIDPCYICRDTERDQSKIVVVEEAKDIIAIEKMERYHGLYHCLNGAISTVNGIGPEDINLVSLFERLKNDEIKELILATNASVEGEITAKYIHKMLENTDILVTRIAHGIPAGGNLEYADEITLSKAIEGRRKL